MLARLHSVTLEGIEGIVCEVEVDVSRGGLERPVIVGLPDAAVKESIERVRSAIVNSGYKYPDTQALVNLAPADIKKSRPRFRPPHRPRHPGHRRHPAHRRSKGLHDRRRACTRRQSSSRQRRLKYGTYRRRQRIYQDNRSHRQRRRSRRRPRYRRFPRRHSRPGRRYPFGPDPRRTNNRRHRQDIQRSLQIRPRLLRRQGPAKRKTSPHHRRSRHTQRNDDRPPPAQAKQCSHNAWLLSYQLLLSKNP